MLEDRIVFIKMIVSLMYLSTVLLSYFVTNDSLLWSMSPQGWCLLSRVHFEHPSVGAPGSQLIATSSHCTLQQSLRVPPPEDLLLSPVCSRHGHRVHVLGLFLLFWTLSGISQTRVRQINAHVCTPITAIAHFNEKKINKNSNMTFLFDLG